MRQERLKPSQNRPSSGAPSDQENIIAILTIVIARVEPGVFQFSMLIVRFAAV
jgi:hypothetical protein